MQYHTHKNCNDLNLNLGLTSIVLSKINKYYRTHNTLSNNNFRVDLISCTTFVHSLVHFVCLFLWTVCSRGAGGAGGAADIMSRGRCLGPCPNHTLSDWTSGFYHP